jgi:hypothetical protein
VCGHTEFSRASQRVFDLAFNESKSLNHPDINTDHLFLGMIKYEACRAHKLIVRFNVDMAEFLRMLYHEYHSRPPEEEQPAGVLESPRDLTDFDPAVLLKKHQKPGEQQWQELVSEMTKGQVGSRNIIVMKGWFTEEDLTGFYEETFKTPYVNLEICSLDLEAALSLPENISRKYKALCLGREGDTFLVAMADPRDYVAADELHERLGAVRLMVAEESLLIKTMDFIFEEEH